MTEVTIQPDAKGDNPAHVAAMLAKANGGATPEGERPAWLPEGFNTPEELAAAYIAAQKGEAPKAPEEKPAEEPPVDQPAATDDSAEKAVEKAGLDMATLEQKVVSGEGLSEEDYTKLAAAGIPKGMVDAYIAGQIALGEQLVQRMHQTVGGQQKFDAIMAWAGAGNLTPAEVTAFNKTIDSGDEAAIKLALSGLAARYTASVGSAPALLGGGRAAGAGDVYESKAQMMADMRDPRYSTDPAFRSKVEAKLARSSIF